MENYVLIIVCALFAAVMIVLVILCSITVAGKARKYKHDLQMAEQTKPVTKYCADVVQTGGHVSVESDGKIMSIEIREE